MEHNKRVYIPVRPFLLVEKTGGASLGRCYSAGFFKVTSTRALDRGVLVGMYELGLLGIGQEFQVRFVTKTGAKIAVPVELPLQFEATGTDEIQCSEVDDTGKVIVVPAINPYNGEPTKPTYLPYYVYECETRCDSGD